MVNPSIMDSQWHPSSTPNHLLIDPGLPPADLLRKSKNLEDGRWAKQMGASSQSCRGTSSHHPAIDVGVSMFFQL